jgi:hypothetical protein
MDAINLGQTELHLRLLFSDASVGPPLNLAITDESILQVGSGWTSLHFSLAPADLTVLTGTVAGALSNVTEFRIFHSADALFPGPAIVAQLGLDNLSTVAPAVGVPEPAIILLFGLVLLGLIAARERWGAGLIGRGMWRSGHA